MKKKMLEEKAQKEAERQKQIEEEKQNKLLEQKKWVIRFFCYYVFANM